MSSSRVLFSTLITGAAVVLAGCSAEAGGPAAGETMVMGNPITGEGIPNPTSTVTANWGQIPAGVPMGTSAGMDIDPNDGNLWTYERCGQGALTATPPAGGGGAAAGGRQGGQAAGGGGGGGGGFGGANCSTDVTHKPIYKLDVNTGAILANFGEGIMVTPHGIGVDPQGNVWVTDFARSADGTKGMQAHKFSPEGQLLMSLGQAGVAGNTDGVFNQPNDVIVAPDGSIFVSDGHDGQGMTTNQAIEEGRAAGSTARISKFSPDGTFLLSWGQLGLEHGQFRTPHSMAFDSRGRLWVADRGNHRIEIFDQQGNYLESRYQYGRISDLFITEDDMVYAIDSESHEFRHINWRNGVRIGPLDRDWIVGYIPPWESASRPQNGVAGEGVAVDADGNVYVAEGPASLADAGSAFTKYEVAR
jgi:hypothetical protein